MQHLDFNAYGFWFEISGVQVKLTSRIFLTWVGTKAQSASAGTKTEYANHSMATDTAMNVLAPVFELACHQLGSQRGVSPQFRVLEDFPAQLDERAQVQFANGLGQCIHHQVTLDQGYRG